jgi:hypothetical protein
MWHGHSAEFVWSYAAVRGVLVASYVRAWWSVPEARQLTGRYACGFEVTAAAWAASTALP